LDFEANPENANILWKTQVLILMKSAKANSKQEDKIVVSDDLNERFCIARMSFLAG